VKVHPESLIYFMAFLVFACNFVKMSKINCKCTMIVVITIID